MHYKNGREAKPGDHVVSLSRHNLIVGVIHSLTTANTCNGRLAQTSPSDAYVTVGECLHMDDVRAAAEKPQADPAPIPQAAT